jgi:hypothetical protein
LWARRIGWLVGLGFEEIDCVATRAYLAINGIRGYRNPPERHTAQRRGLGVELAQQPHTPNSQPVLYLYFTKIVHMSPNPAPFCARLLTI